MLYVVNRGDAVTFSPAEEIDPEYAKLLREAAEVGVEILVYRCDLSESEVSIKTRLEALL